MDTPHHAIPILGMDSLRPRRARRLELRGIVAEHGVEYIIPPQGVGD